MSRRPLARLGLAVVLIAVIGAVALRGLARRAFFPEPETDPARYAAILATWQPTGLVALFPNAIPSDAQAVRFSAFPGAGQGGPWIELRLKLPGLKVAAIEAAARGATKHAYPPDHGFTLPASGDNWPIPNCHTGAQAANFRFEAASVIYVYSAVDHGQGSWDPYDTHGVTVSKDTGEVTYWADR